MEVRNENISQKWVYKNCAHVFMANFSNIECFNPVFLTHFWPKFPIYTPETSEMKKNRFASEPTLTVTPNRHQPAQS